MRDFLEFEKPLKELEERIDKLSKTSSDKKAVPRLSRILQARLAKAEMEIYSKLMPWQQVQIARHAQRPSILKYIEAFCEDFVELHGDRTFGDDQAIVGGFATFRGRSICVIGHEKGQGGQRASEAKLRDAQPRRLSEGPSSHEAGPEIQ